MKKLISVVLLLAMCLSLFAGCNKTPAEKPVSNLENAKTRLFNMYKPGSKDEVPAKSSDFEVVASVLVDGTSYAVEWAVTVTKGAADAVKVVDGSSAAYKKVDVTEKPEETIEFTLTGTIKEGAESVSVSFNYIVPAVQAPSAEKVVIYFPDSNQYITGIHYLYTSSSGTQKQELVLTDNKAEALALTVVDNGDNTVSFLADGGYYLLCDGSNVMFVTAESGYTKYVLEAANAEGGYFIQSMATYNDKPQYLEVYSGYLTCYGMNAEKANIYTFNLEAAENAAGTIVPVDTGSTEDPTEPTDPADPTEPSNPSNPGTTTGDPAANSTLTIADAIALGASKAHNTYTEGKYYVTGKITEIYNEQYGNMKITDNAGNILTIYGTFSADGVLRFDAMSNKPKVGDEVTIYGIVGQYNDTPQVKNGWIVKINGKTPTESSTPSTPATPSNLSIASSLTVGKAYKFGMVQQLAGKTVYLAGGMSGFYMATTEDASAALDVYVEETSGGYYLYAMVSGTKTYINMVKAMGTDGKEHINGMYESAPSTVYTWDANAKTLVADFDGEAYWHGTRNDKTYLTVGPCAVKYEGFYCQFYA